MASLFDEAANKRKHVDYEQRCIDERRGGASEAYGRGYPREDTPPAQCSVLCGPRSCSTLPSSLGNQNDGGTSPPEPKRRRLWGLRGLVKMFRRRVKRKGGADPSENSEAHAPTVRAMSASELTVDPANRSSGGPYNQGLSVSHDSVFSPESPSEQTHTAPPGLSLATRGVNMVGNMSELKAALRRRRGLDSDSVEDDPDDPGLPRSPHTSPTTLDVLNHGLKNSSRGAQSSCSDGSLLSMGSSENDEDSLDVLSRHSSKHSLIERQQVIDNEPAVGAAPLSHKAARHKISVRPKRTHALPRARKQAQVLPPSSLPATPEVNEDGSIRAAKAVQGSSSTPPFRTTQERPSSISFSSIENQFSKSRSERGEDRKSVRKSLPQAGSHAEEKKEEPPLLSRLFGSVRSSGHKGGDDPRDVTRVSREKRKDPFKTPSGAKSSRQRSDPSRLSYEDASSERNGSQRSSSVEGRLEGNPMMEEVVVVVPPSQAEIRGAEEGRRTLEMEEEESSPSMSAQQQQQQQRLSSSYDCLGGLSALPDAVNLSSLEGREARSSTDSLTTTPLPGIYIRANQTSSVLTRPKRTSLHNQAQESIARWKEEQHQYHHLELDHLGAGPLSLDSSLSAVQYEEDEMRKALSVDQVTVSSSSSLEGILPGGGGAADPPVGHSLLPVSRPVTILRSVSVHSQPSSRGSSGRSRKSSSDELEADPGVTSRVPLRKVKREASLKKPPEEDPPRGGGVPEFLRIQLNRVQSGDSEPPPGAPPVRSPLPNVKIEAMDPNARRWDRSGGAEEVERPRDSSEIVVEESAKPEGGGSTTGGDAPSTSSSPGPDAGVLQPPPPGRSPPAPPKEEIVLRRPSVVDRALVIDQTMTSVAPLPKKGDQPELFKVFARRSFKLKDDVALDPPLEDDSAPGDDVDKENHVPAPRTTSDKGEPHQQQPRFRKHERSSLGGTPLITPPPLPTLKSISSKRYSTGGAPSPAPPDPKPTVIVLSGNNSIPAEEDPKTPHPVGDPRPPLKAPHRDKGLKVSLLHGRSQSLSPSDPKRTAVEEGLSSSSEDNVEVEGSARGRRARSSSKGDSSPRVGEGEGGASPFNSAIIRRSILATSTTGDSSETSSLEGSQSPLTRAGPAPTRKTPRGQPVVWPPRSSTQAGDSDSSEGGGGPPPPSHQDSSSCRASPLPPRPPAGLPPSRILNSFKESSTDGNESSQSSAEEDFSLRGPKGPDAPLKKSPKEGGGGSSSPLLLAEARNTSFGHSFDNPLAYLSPPKGGEEGGRGASEDWRVLVRQRREDRMKQTKTPEAEEIIIETRPSVSRNSKVLEMANNFQKLQVA